MMPNFWSLPRSAAIVGGDKLGAVETSDMLSAAGSLAGAADFTLISFTNQVRNANAFNRVAVAGFGANKTATVSGGGSFRKNASGAFGTSPITVSDGDTIDLIRTNSNSYDTEVSATLQIDGVSHTMTSRTSINAANMIQAFYLNPLSHSAEAALGGDWATHQTKWQANRRDNYVWGQGGSAWDPAHIYWLMRYLRGSALADDLADHIFWMDSYNTDNPTGYHSQDAWLVGDSHFIDYLYNARGFNVAGCRLGAAEWMHDTGFNYLPTGTYWTQRYPAKNLMAVLGAVISAVPNGTYTGSIVDPDFPGGPPALLRAYVDNIIAMATTNDGWVGQGMYYWPVRNDAYAPWSKPWQDAAIIRSLILAHIHFYPYDDALKAIIIGGCEWCWAVHAQYTDQNTASLSTSSGKWSAIYSNRYVIAGSDTNTVEYLSPDLTGFYTGLFGYCYALTGDTTWRTRLRRILKSQINDSWYTAGPGNITGNKIMAEQVFTPWASLLDSQTYPAPSFPVCSSNPVGGISSGSFIITDDGSWSGSPTATQREIWLWNCVVTSGGAYRWAATGSSMSVAGLTGRRIKGRVRKQNGSGWGSWADTEWSVVP